LSRQLTSFEKGTRYYTLQIQRDLFGWVVIASYGRIDTKLGQVITTPFDDLEGAEIYLHQEIDRRIKRGYFIS
jgi:predicted DNA-binding WGR domain protein